MTIREQTERIERDTLHPRACLSEDSRGRLRPEKEGTIRTCFQRDRDRIIHSKSFRRLKHKTQVFLAPKGDHYRTRLTHALEVAQIGRTIARALRLNEDLTEAIALGHDLGHAPFGHAGEAVLEEIYPGGFKHFEQSLRVVDLIENQGMGLNLTHEVRDGILKHSKGQGMIFVPGTSDTLEGQIVRVSDAIAYLNHDLDDALRAGVIKRADLDKDLVRTLGATHSRRIDTMVKSVIFTSLDGGMASIAMGPEILGAVDAMRAFLYERVYEGETTKGEFRKAKKVLFDLYAYYMEHPEEAFEDFPLENKIADTQRLVCDFIAGMTDRFAIMTYERLFMPAQWAVY